MLLTSGGGLWLASLEIEKERERAMSFEEIGVRVGESLVDLCDKCLMRFL